MWPSLTHVLPIYHVLIVHISLRFGQCNFQNRLIWTCKHRYWSSLVEFVCKWISVNLDGMYTYWNIYSCIVWLTDLSYLVVILSDLVFVPILFVKAPFSTYPTQDFISSAMQKPYYIYFNEMHLSYLEWFDYYLKYIKVVDALYIMWINVQCLLLILSANVYPFLFNTNWGIYLPILYAN